MTIVATPRFVEHDESDHDGNEPSVAAPYLMPTFRRLGVWNLFTRQASPSTVDNGGETGFFELDFGL